MKSKLRNLIEMLQQAAEEHCEGGYGPPYPDEIALAGSYVVIAGHSDNCEVSLRIYNKQDAIDWHDAAVQYQHENPEADLVECLLETDPGESEVD